MLPAQHHRGRPFFRSSQKQPADPQPPSFPVPRWGFFFRTLSWLHLAQKTLIEHFVKGLSYYGKQRQAQVVLECTKIPTEVSESLGLASRSSLAQSPVPRAQRHALRLHETCLSSKEHHELCFRQQRAPRTLLSSRCRPKANMSVSMPGVSAKTRAIGRLSRASAQASLSTSEESKSPVRRSIWLSNFATGSARSVQGWCRSSAFGHTPSGITWPPRARRAFRISGNDIQDVKMYCSSQPDCLSAQHALGTYIKHP